VINKTKTMIIIVNIIWVSVCLCGDLFAASISIEAVTAKPNDTVTVDFMFQSEGDFLSAINFDLIYQSADLELDLISVGSSATAADKQIATHAYAEGVEKVVLYGLNDTAIATGVLMQVTFTIKNDATDGEKTVSIANSTGASPEANSVTVSAENAAIAVDGTAPVLTLTSPAEGALVASETVNISGSVDDLSILAVDINTTSVPVSDGSFSHAITLSEGEQTIVVVARDAAGNSISLERVVTIDLTAPVITITEPFDGENLGSDIVTVSGSIDDSAIESVDINGTLISVTNGSFTGPVTLSDGAQTITVTASDEAGNEGSSSIDVTIDTAAPVVTIVSPVEGDSFGTRSVVVSGALDDSEITEVDINGQIVAVTDGNFSMTLILDEGENTITVTAVDSAGNDGYASISVTISIGDVNEDGIIDGLDIEIIKQQILSEVGQSVTADVNNDGVINVIDLQSVINKL
jgi:nitrogen fixation protein FixH